MKYDVKTLVINAIIAALYAALTVFMAPIAYGPIQARLSEIMVFLAFYNKKYIPGLVLGCVIANIPSSLGMVDVIFGTLSTVFVCLMMDRVNNRYLSAFLGAVITGLIIGAELTVVFKLPFVMTMFEVFVGEVFVLVIGAVVFGMIEKNSALMERIMA